MHSSAHVSSRVRATQVKLVVVRFSNQPFGSGDQESFTVLSKSSKSSFTNLHQRPLLAYSRTRTRHTLRCILAVLARSAGYVRSPGQRGGRGPRTPCVAYSALFSQGQIVNVRTVHTDPQTEQILPVPACCWMHYTTLHLVSRLIYVVLLLLICLCLFSIIVLFFSL